MTAFIVLLATLAVIVIGVEVVGRATRLPLELTRKLTHILVGTLVAFAPFYMPIGFVALLAVMFTAVIAVSRRAGIFRSIHDPNRSGVGELWYPVGILAAALFFPEPHAFAFGVLTLALADGLAGLAGKLYGRTRIKGVIEPKTYVGSLTFLVVAFAIAVFFLPLPIAACAALVLTAVELVSFRGLDNVVLPLVAGLFVALS